MHRRDYKDFAKGGIYHLFNRGDNREIVFRDKQDYRAFLFRLGLAMGYSLESLNGCEVTKSPKSRIRINGFKIDNFKLHGFCLMPNHFHLLVEQGGDISISNLILKICTSFSKYINEKYDRVGHIFQDQFKAVRIETNAQLMLVSSYIHMNPVKDKLVNKPEDYSWSSFNDFILDRNNEIITTNFLTQIFGTKDRFEKENVELYKQKMSKVPFDILDVV